ncbi:MAG: bifunctional 5,10-methylenetetrahydrofolate dehydrogenase/5,10-methenyltetrahydrofolate cyclohydrolase [Coriobacteriales bacterium]|nr:bifunctional 5,10-methylenetetrahydrofolate dehydrogenase/5,10-methenyltetrahydrofolate cyclohydrolase [Coriobacteriales bacterium]
MAVLLKGLPVAKALTQELCGRARSLEERGITPTLAIVRVGEREDDLTYERAALKRCAAVGIRTKSFVLEADCIQGELLDVITQVNANPSIHGCLMFRPLPKHLDEEAACAALDTAKDVDCSTAASLYGVFANQPVGFPPCTAEACIALLDHYGIALDGADVVVVGRSLVIGRPVAAMLMARNATVTVCHTHTRDLSRRAREADVLVVAAGHAGVLGDDAVRPGQVVLDVGINWDERAQRLCGDVVFEKVEPIVDAITPVPGGVGSVTTAILAKHVIEAAERLCAGDEEADDA